jgi:hypothetical protein
MSTTRRRFVQQTMMAGPVAMTFWLDPGFAWGQGGPECTLPTPPKAEPFVPNEPKVVARISAAEMGQDAHKDDLKIFRDAIGAVRALPPDDVTSWTKLVAQHCINCASSNTANIHYDWFFLPWHRALLYFLERHLRIISKHDDLRLIYWDWENPNSRVIPSIYVPPGQSLYWKNRTLTGPNWPLPDNKVDVQPSLATPSFEVFGGTAVQNKPRPLAYSGPHAPVHNAFNPGDMGNLQYSPRDPVFYAHHSNIDRLWTSWVAASPSTHKNPDFGKATVYFYDENKKYRSVLLNDLRDESKLGYKYSSLMQSTVQASKLRSFKSSHTPTAANALPKFMLQSTHVTALTASSTAPEYLIIQNIQHLESFGEDVLTYGIFSVSPAVGSVAKSAAGFLGEVSRVISESHNHPGPLSAGLTVTGKFPALLQGSKGAINLFVAPLDPAGKVKAAAIPLDADDITVVA